jgi:hypothetical protein
MHLRGGVKVSGKEPHGDEEIMLTDGVLMRSNGRQVEAGMHMVVNMQWRRRPSWERERERKSQRNKGRSFVSRSGLGISALDSDLVEVGLGGDQGVKGWELVEGLGQGAHVWGGDEIRQGGGEGVDVSRTNWWW